MSFVTIEQRDGVSLVTVDRPPANALDRELGLELIATAAALAADPPRAVVLTGTRSFFSAGLDLKTIPALEPDEQREMVLGVSRLAAGWYGLPCPLVCAVNGHAIAGGLVLALCGDYRVGATTGKLGLTEVRVGVPYPAGAIAVVAAELEPATVRTLVLGGQLVEPPRALALGLVDELAAPNDLMTRALAVARELAGSPADTYARIKQQLRGETVAKLDRLVRERADPLLQSWLSSEVVEAAGSALRPSS